MRLVHDDWDDEDIDDEDIDDGPDDATMPCPHCRRSVYEDAERCPSCGKYLSLEDAPRHRPLWLIVGVGVCLAIIYNWIFFI